MKLLHVYFSHFSYHPDPCAGRQGTAEFAVRLSQQHSGGKPLTMLVSNDSSQSAWQVVAIGGMIINTASLVGCLHGCLL